MLQQTKINIVIPYFNRWIKKFPNYKYVAQSKNNTVLKYWEGLGYYSRAINLRKVCKILTKRSSIPKSWIDWIKFPGIGKYTASSISSIAFKEPIAVVDGNVIRVLSRLKNIKINFKNNAHAYKIIFPIAQKILNKEEPGIHNQSIMDLGFSICYHKKPNCIICPIKIYCLTFQNLSLLKKNKKFILNIPPIFKKNKKKNIKVNRIFLKKKNKVLLYYHNLNSKLLPGIYELPILKKPFKKEYSKIKRIIGNKILFEKIFKIEFNFPKRKIIKYIDNSIFLNCKLISFKKLRKIPISSPHKKWLSENYLENKT
jgi:A/G-specific adenine glycosylase